MQGTWVQSLGQEDVACLRATRSRATTIEPMLYSPGTATTEACAYAPQQEKPLQWEACTQQLESSPSRHYQRKAHAAQPKINQSTKKKVPRYGCPRLPQWYCGKEHACQCKRHMRHGFSPWVRKLPWRRAWQPNPMDRGGWWAIVHKVTKNWTQLGT